MPSSRAPERPATARARAATAAFSSFGRFRSSTRLMRASASDGPASRIPRASATASARRSASGSSAARVFESAFATAESFFRSSGNPFGEGFARALPTFFHAAWTFASPAAVSWMRVPA